MTASTTPLQTVLGTQTIDKSVIPAIPAKTVVITSYNLKPGANTNYWCDNINVNEFVQPISTLTTNVGFNANLFSVGEGIFCPTTNAYAVVEETSQGNTLYINENFACLRVTPYGSNTLASMATQFNVNDIVYQSAPLNTPNVYSNNMMMGKVAYWNVATGSLAITVQQGTLYAGNSYILFKVGSTLLANVTNQAYGNNFPVGAAVYSTSNTSKFFLANTYHSKHGLIAQSETNSSQIRLTGLTSLYNVIGQNVRIVSGTGLGAAANILAANLITAVVNIDSTMTVTGNSHYAIGNSVVDNIGIDVGLFHFPEDVNYYFQSGSRLFTVNDSANSATDNNATMRSTASFVAAGQLPIGTAVTPVVQPTPPLSPAANTTVTPSAPTSISINNNSPVNNPAAVAYPLVQTFFTPQANTNGTSYGCFATSVNLFFQSVPTGNSTQFPVTVYLVTTVNGYPTSNVLAVSTMRTEEINITDGSNTFPNSANSFTYTNFQFADPVYLQPGTEYGIAIYSESPSYNVWTAQIGQPVANGTALVSQSPYVGSFFKPQNASAWNPIQDIQLMFTLNKAAFSQSPTSAIFSVVPPVQNTYMDMIMIHSADLTFPAANIVYGVQSTIANSGSQDSAFKPVNSDIPFYYGGDLINSSLDSNRRRLIQAGNANSCLVQVTMQSNNPDISPIFNGEAFGVVSFGNIINTGGISQDDITILTPGNHINAANIVVTIGAPTGDNGLQATGYVASLSGNSVIAVTISNPGAGYISSPTITLSEPSAPANATAFVTGEDQQAGGNFNVRYITRPITLADGFDSGDLAVFLEAIRPQGTDISVYYKVLSAFDTQPLANVYWQLMTKVNDIYSPDQQTSVNINYNTGFNSLGVPFGTAQYIQNGIVYPLGGKFKTFQIKIVMSANDPTVPPEVQSMRIAAIPSG